MTTRRQLQSRPSKRSRISASSTPELETEPEKWRPKTICNGLIVFVDNEWETQGEEPKEHRDICSICHRGGDLVQCDSCSHSVCQIHLENATLRELNRENLECPYCHIKNNPDEPYIGFTNRNNHFDIDTTSFDNPIAETNPGVDNILILTIYLNDERISGVEAGVAFAPVLDLGDMFPGQVVEAAVPFNFMEQSDVTAFQSKMDALAGTLDRGFLKRITRVSVILFSLTDKTTGDLHIARNDRNSRSLKELTDMLFPSKFKATLKRLGPKSNMILYNSGIFWQQVALQKQVLACLDEFQLNHILGFTEKNWNWALTTPFLMFAIRSFFVEGLNVATISERLVGEAYGLHSGVVYAERSSDCIKAVTFHHPLHRPFGVRLDRQCKVCGWLDAWGNPHYRLRAGTKEVELLILQCRNPQCTNELSTEKPPGRLRSRKGEGRADYRTDQGDVMIEEIYRDVDAMER